MRDKIVRKSLADTKVSKEADVPGARADSLAPCGDHVGAGEKCEEEGLAERSCMNWPQPPFPVFLCSPGVGRR